MQYWAPANQGVDQNGYLVGGRLLAEHGSMAIHADGDPYSFVARMWIGTDLGTPAERYYPKYPIGLPLLVAAAWLIHGPWLAYLISPVMMTAGLLACYLIARQLLSPYASLLSCIILATSTTTLALTNNPNSHGADFFCVTWGMFFLLSWWQRQGFWRAVLAGLLIGYAATIRYTEGLLIIPIALTILFALRWRSARSWTQSILLLLAWLLPIGLMLWHNQLAFGAWTGYDPTRESTGFSLENLQNNWETMTRQLANTGLFFILPLGIIGLIRMMRSKLRLSLVLWSWALPAMFLYTAYYWAPDGANIGYMRFFLTLFPPLVIAAAWLLEQLFTIARRPASPLRNMGSKLKVFIAHLLSPLPLGIAAAVAALMGLSAAMPMMENSYRADLAIQSASNTVLHKAPPGSVIFAEDRLLHQLQFVGDYSLYNFDPFNQMSLRRLVNLDEEMPHPLQVQRAAALLELLKDKNNSQLTKEQNDLMRRHLQAGQHVYFVIPKTAYDRTYKRFITKDFKAEPIATWQEPVNLQAALRPRWIGFTIPRQRPMPQPPSWVMVQIVDAATH